MRCIQWSLVLLFYRFFSDHNAVIKKAARSVQGTSGLPYAYYDYHVSARIEILEVKSGFSVKIAHVLMYSGPPIHETKFLAGLCSLVPCSAA